MSYEVEKIVGTTFTNLAMGEVSGDFLQHRGHGHLRCPECL